MSICTIIVYFIVFKQFLHGRILHLHGRVSGNRLTALLIQQFFFFCIILQYDILETNTNFVVMFVLNIIRNKTSFITWLHVFEPTLKFFNLKKNIIRLLTFLSKTDVMFIIHDRNTASYFNDFWRSLQAAVSPGSWHTILIRIEI